MFAAKDAALKRALRRAGQNNGGGITRCRRRGWNRTA
jgi:hypothetical protein